MLVESLIEEFEFEIFTDVLDKLGCDMEIHRDKGTFSFVDHWR